MNMNEVIGALFFAVFAANSVLIRSAGLDSAERFSRDKQYLLYYSAIITASALAADMIAFTLLLYVLPAIGVNASTLLDGVVIVLSVLVSSVAIEAVIKYRLPAVLEKLGGEVFSVGYNSAVAGIVLLCRAESTDFGKSIIYCVIFSASVVIVYYLISIWRLDIKEHRLTDAFRGAPVLFLLMGLAAMVFQGFVGMEIPEDLLSFISNI